MTSCLNDLPAGLGDLLVGGVLLGVADVLLDGAVEEHRLLGGNSIQDLNIQN